MQLIYFSLFLLYLSPVNKFCINIINVSSLYLIFLSSDPKAYLVVIFFVSKMCVVQVITI